MNVTVERTEKEILTKLPLDTAVSDIQRILNYFEYIQIAGKSKATQEQIDELAREVNQGWWEKNKDRFIEEEDFEGLK